MGRRVYSIVLAVLLCVAGLVILVTIDLLGQASGIVDVALVAGAVPIVLLPVYMIARPPSFNDGGEDDPGGGASDPSPTPPDSPAPPDGLPDADWSSFDDLRRDWEREPAGR